MLDQRQVFNVRSTHCLSQFQYNTGHNIDEPDILLVLV